MSATTQADDTDSTVPFTEDQISDQLDIQTGPATALSTLSGWDELRAGIQDDRNWEGIDGIGPATAETLNEADADALPVEASPTPDSPDAKSEVSADVETDAEAVAGPKVESDDSPEVEPDAGDASETPTDEDSEDAETADDAGESADDAGEVDTEPDGEPNAGADTDDDDKSLFDLRNAPAQFEASIELSRLKSVFDTMSRLVDETKIRIGEDRIVIRAVDAANVGMIDLDMQARAFQSFRADMGVIGVNVGRMVDVLSVGNSGDTVHLQLNPETRKLVVTVDGLEYTLALIDPASIRQEPEIPELMLNSEVKMEGSVLSRAVKSADMVSEHIGFSYSEHSASFHADGDTDDVDFDLSGLEAVEQIDNDGKGNSLFSLDYLKDISRMVPNSETVTAEFGDEMPLKFFFNVADSHAKVETLLAPRIQSD